MRYVRRISGLAEEEAKDILQEAFIKIWRNLNEYDTDLKLSSWIYRIVHNETISYWRKSKSHDKDQTLSLDDEFIEYEDPGQVENDSNPDPNEKIEKVLDSLPLKYREVLTLKFLEKMSYGEVSDVLKIPEGTVATRINRAKKLFIKVAGERRIHFFE
jgi:RNA polymerase sigma-70 factor (ECF subfamily)